MALAVGLRDDLVADHKQHGPGRKPQPPGQQAGRCADNSRPQHGAQGLDQARCHAQPHRQRAPVARRQQRHGHHQALGHILDGDARGQRVGPQGVAARMRNADGQPLGQAVQRNRKHKQPGALQRARRRGALHALDEMLVRQQALHPQQHQRPQQDGPAHRGPRAPGARPCPARRMEARDDQRERTGRQHHARAKAKQRVLRALGQPLRQQHRQRAQSSGQCSHQAAPPRRLHRGLAGHPLPRLGSGGHDAQQHNAQAQPLPPAQSHGAPGGRGHVLGGEHGGFQSGIGRSGRHLHGGGSGVGNRWV